MPRWKAGQAAPTIHCPACPGVFRTKQGLSHHCTSVHNNPLAVLQQIRYETHVSPSVPCSLTHVIAVTSIDVMRTQRADAAAAAAGAAAAAAADAPRELWNASNSCPRPVVAEKYHMMLYYIM